MTPRDLIDALAAVNRTIFLTNNKDQVHVDAKIVAAEIIKEISKCIEPQRKNLEK